MKFKLECLNEHGQRARHEKKNNEKHNKLLQKHDQSVTSPC